MSTIENQLRSTVAEALASGWSMLALAEAAGVPRSSLREWYYDGKGMHGETLMHLADFFGMRLTKARIPARAKGGD